GLVERGHALPPVVDGSLLRRLPATDFAARVRPEEGARGSAFTCCACRAFLSLGEHGPSVLPFMPQPLVGGCGALDRRWRRGLRAVRRQRVTVVEVSLVDVARRELHALARVECDD